MRRLLRLAALVGLAVWAWRAFVGSRRPHERATAAYADGSSIVLEPGSDGFERLAAVARTALGG
jgi:hypothetical protein